MQILKLIYAQQNQPTPFLFFHYPRIPRDFTQTIIVTHISIIET